MKTKQKQIVVENLDYLQSLKREEKIIVKVPALPPKEASPNWRGHWAEKYQALKAYKELTVLVARQNRPARPYSNAIIATTFIVPNRRYIKDGDNAIASLKSAIDGLEIAGVIENDRNVIVLPPVYIVMRGSEGETVLAIEEVEGPSPRQPRLIEEGSLKRRENRGKLLGR